MTNFSLTLLALAAVALWDWYHAQPGEDDGAGN